MMSWNYRVIEYVDPDGALWRAIHEVHYDKEFAPISYTEEPVCLAWEADIEPAELIDLMKTALGKPTLIEKDFHKHKGD